MAAVQRKLLWDANPESDNFLVYSPSEIRLHALNAPTAHVKTLAVVTDLPVTKCLAWSTQNIHAAGLSTGKTLILRINTANMLPVNETPQSVLATMSARVSRSVNAIAFSPLQPNLLAIGYDKGRDYGLVLCDINGVTRSTYSAKQPDIKILTSFGSGESVSSLLFLTNASSPLLIASMSKWIRAYDSRYRATSQGTPSSATQLIFSAKSATSLANSPLDRHTFSATEESSGIVRIFDIRKSSNEVLAISPSELHFLPTNKPTPIVSTTWSPVNRGQVVTVDVNGNLSSFNIFTNAPAAEDSVPTELEYSVIYSSYAGRLASIPSAACFVGSSAASSALMAVSKEGALEIASLKLASRFTWDKNSNLVRTNYKQQLAFFEKTASSLPKEEEEDEDGHDAEQSTINRDASSVMRDRALAGYGADAQYNVSLMQDHLRQAWHFIHQAEKVSKCASAAISQAAFEGIFNLLKLRSTEELASVLKALEYKINVHVSTQLLNQRKISLVICGPQYATEDVQTLLASNQPEQAAAHALFAGNTDLAIKAILKSARSDDRLKLLAPALAATYQPSNGHSAFEELCTTLSSELDSPYLRAMFAYVGSRDWQDVLEEQGLPLTDKLAIALRFLPDEDLLRFVSKTAATAITSGDLEGLACVGLTSGGMTLLSTYLDKTGDVQTSALLASYFNFTHTDRRLERWIHAYRSLLDLWSLYICRAKFDVTRSARSRSFKAEHKSTDLNASDSRIEKPATSNDLRIFVRCNYCNLILSPTNIAAVKNKMRTKATTCHRCGKSFPKCCICLFPISVMDAVSDAAAQAWTFCSSCRHGGHADHLLSWFKTHDECPVAGCDCTNCKM